jgi:hypothetical protein
MFFLFFKRYQKLGYYYNVCNSHIKLEPHIFNIINLAQWQIRLVSGEHSILSSHTTYQP